MNNKLVVLAITGTFLLNAAAAELFPDSKPVEFVKDSQLDSVSTVGGYPIYRGDGGWRISGLNVNTPNAFGGATEIPIGMVKLVQLEPNGDWFANQQVAVNLKITGTNQFTTGSPCGGTHLIAINKARGRDDNCITVDASSFQSGNKSTTFFSLLSTQTRSAGRRYIVSLQLNADLLGFRETSPADWTAEIVNNEPSRKIFIERLKKWAEMLQDATARTAEYDAPKDVFASIPSYRTLLPVPADLSDGTYSQQFIGAVESTRNKRDAKAIAFTKVSPIRTKWANQYAMDDQAAADKLALEACERGRPTAAEPCKLYDLGKAVSTVPSTLQSGTQLGAGAVSPPAQSKSVENRLQELKSLMDKGLITQDILNQRRVEILKEL